MYSILLIHSGEEPVAPKGSLVTSEPYCKPFPICHLKHSPDQQSKREPQESVISDKSV